MLFWLRQPLFRLRLFLVWSDGVGLSRLEELEARLEKRRFSNSSLSLSGDLKHLNGRVHHEFSKFEGKVFENPLRRCFGRGRYAASSFGASHVFRLHLPLACG